MNDKKKEKETSKVINPDDEEPTLDDIRQFVPSGEISNLDAEKKKKKVI